MTNLIHKKMKWFVGHSWFILIEFSCIIFAGILWDKFRGLTWQPLLIALLPVFLHIAARMSPFRRTPFDLPIVIFILTAGMGIWTAYQPAITWTKFWFLIASILFYYLLSRQSVDNLWTAAIVLTLMGVGVSLFFFFSNNFELQSQKYQLLGQIGSAWMKVRPNFNLQSTNPNDIAGIAVIALPFSLTLMLRYWRKKTRFLSVLFGLVTGLIGAAILLSASRGAWSAIGISGILCLIWWMSNRWFKLKAIPSHRAIIIACGLLLTCVAGGIIWSSLNQRLSQIAVGTDDSPLISASRFHVFWSAVELIRDVPFTGGGLDSFPGLYSTYIMINPNYILGYSHNIYLDAVLQLGILGGLMLCWIIIGSIVYLAVRSVPEEHSLLRYAILSSLLISVFRGLVDNIVLRTMFTMLLFFVPGMAVGLLSSTNPKPDIARHEKAISRHLAIAILTVLCLVLLGYAVCYKSVWSAWYTDLGCVKMAKIQLANFPTSTWDEGKQTNLLQPAESLFSQALVYDPTNPRAHYRLGLIALLNRDFTNAIYHLKIANRGDPYHRGIIKALGYSYLWDGQFVAARSFLSLLPESNQEIAVYSWWWGQQQRPDLSANAAQYLKLVENSR